MLERIEEIAQRLGVSLGREFFVMGYKDGAEPFLVYLVPDGLFDDHDEPIPEVLESLLMGECQVRIAWRDRPELGDPYWYMGDEGYPVYAVYSGSPEEEELLSGDQCFLSPEEAAALGMSRAERMQMQG